MISFIIYFYLFTWKSFYIIFNKDNAMQNFSGIKFLIPLVVIWGFTYPFTKEISVYVSPLIISCSRIGISTIFFLFMARGYVFGKKEMIAGLLNIFAFLTLLNLGISESNNPGLASVMIYTQPIFVIIFEMLLGYRPARRIILGIIIAFAGVSLSITSVKFDIGIIIALIAAIFWAGGTVFYSRNLKNANVLKLNAFMALISFPFSISITPFDFYFKFSLKVIFFILILAILAQVFGYYLWFNTVKTLGSVRASAGVLLVPVFAFIFTFIMLDVKPGILQIGGSTITLIGVFTALRPPK